MAKTLVDYRGKRDFKKTTEPRGKAMIRSADYPRFVVQKHDATRLHYDLRLEVDGVFKSWAVTRGPSIDPGDKRLAVEVEDHPLDYGDFEGTIPDDQYGGGTVMIWDRGFWSPIGEKSAAEALAAGELKFNIAGERMKGSWVLVRMHHDRAGGKRNNWLLIKHRDEWARPGDGDHLLDADRSVASRRTMAQIAAGRGGAGPAPFMVAKRKAGASDAVWDFDVSRSEAEAARRSTPSRSDPPEFAEWHGNTILGVTISNPDKELWPASEGSAAVTKRDLVGYLVTVGPWMIDHLRGRPCSLYRAPDGIDGEMFFQRHTGVGLSEFVGRIRISGDRQQYLKIDDLRALVALGQIAVMEFHPGNCVPDEVEVPGRLIFDLDPAPDVPFRAVVEAARELRQRVERLGLVAFCKTTGGKGLHVVTPLKMRGNDQLGWAEAKIFAQTVSAQMADDSPQRYLVKMTKEIRKGRIYLDYLRNDRLSTAVAPLSPRARPGATVSMPLSWRQVRADLEPKRFTIHTVPPLLAKTTAWKDYAASERPLKDAIKKLVGHVR